LTCEEINNMTRIALSRSDVVVGVDTHKEEHLAVALDGLGGRLGELAVAANPEGYAQLLTWADGLGVVAMFGVAAPRRP
jgi:transposase